MYRVFLPYPVFLSGFASIVIRLPLIASTDQIATECDIKSTGRAFLMSLRAFLMSFRDNLMSLRARHEFRLTSDRLRLFEFADSCGCSREVVSKRER